MSERESCSDALSPERTPGLRAGHAGAVVDGETARRAERQGVDLDRALARFDSAAACAELGLAISAFDSGTNLCDLVLLDLQA